MTVTGSRLGKNTLAAIAAMVFTYLTACGWSYAEDKGVGWSRDALVAKVGELWELGEISATIEEIDRSLRGPSETRSCFGGEADTIWSLAAGPQTVSGPLTNIWMAGVGDEVHSIQIFFPVVAASQGDGQKALGVLDGVFRHLLPRWSGADDWAESSLRGTWDIVAEKMAGRRELASMKDAFVQQQVGSARLVTFGVPPDFVRYGVTVADCEVMPTESSAR